MMLHSYPLLISIYKGEGRMLIVPLIDHVAGYSIDSDWFINLSDVNNALSVTIFLLNQSYYNVYGAGCR